MITSSTRERYLMAPMVNGKKFPYTKTGKKMAAMAKKLKKRGKK